MSAKRLLLVVALALLVGAVAFVCLAPVASPALFRLWLGWSARQQNVDCTWTAIEAPLFRPVVVRDLKVRSRRGAAVAISLDIDRAELDLHLAAFLNSGGVRALRQLKLEGMRGEVRYPTTAERTAHLSLRGWQRLIADNFLLSFGNFRISRGDISLELHDATISASELESGHVQASAVILTTPWFRKSFAGLRGATSWQYDRLTIGAISLAAGLDLDAITFDFAHLGDDQLRIETSVDAFGGKLRSSISTRPGAWDAAATATQISLAEASDDLGLSSRAAGTIQSSKFTFSGDPQNLPDATASIWAEAENFTWRDRTADTIMLGASLFARQIQIEQIYVKQRANQFTLSGESALPRKASEWPEFRGDVSASITDLSDFARLFGGKASDFGGELEINGSISEQEHKLGGQLVASGKLLTLFGAPVDSLGGNFGLTESAVVIHQFDLRHGADSATARGTVDLSPGHRFTGHIAARILDLAPFRNFLVWTGDFLRPEGSISLEIQSDPGAPGGAGTFSVRGTALRLLEPSSLLPFDALFQGTYSADNIFFRRFDLRNDHAAFTTFLTVATDYVQLQDLRFEVNEKPVIDGEIYAPLTLNVPPENGRWISGIVPESTYSVDLRVPDLDLAESARATSTRQDIAGKVGARIELYGTTENPVGQFALHVRDLASTNAARLSGDVEGSLVRDVLSGKANLAVAGSPPAQMTFSLPVEFEPNSSSYRLRTDSKFDFSANFPAVALAKLPSFLKPGFAQDGTVRARVAASGLWPHPQMQGTAEFADIAFTARQKLSGRFLFRGNAATVEGGKFAEGDLALSFVGAIDLNDVSDLLINLRFARVQTMTPRDARDERCIDGLHLTNADAPTDGPAGVDHALLRGALFRPGWSLTLDQSGEVDAALPPLIFCDKSENEGEPLTLGLAR